MYIHIYIIYMYIYVYIYIYTYLGRRFFKGRDPQKDTEKKTGCRSARNEM